MAYSDLPYTYILRMKWSGPGPGNSSLPNPCLPEFPGCQPVDDIPSIFPGRNLRKGAVCQSCVCVCVCVSDMAVCQNQ